MENKYIISEPELIDLLATHYYFWYKINKKEYLKEFESFVDLAKNDLKYYTKIKEGVLC